MINQEDYNKQVWQWISHVFNSVLICFIKLPHKMTFFKIIYITTSSVTVFFWSFVGSITLWLYSETKKRYNYPNIFLCHEICYNLKRYCVQVRKSHSRESRGGSGYYRVTCLYLFFKMNSQDSIYQTLGNNYYNYTLPSFKDLIYFANCSCITPVPTFLIISLSFIPSPLSLSTETFTWKITTTFPLNHVSMHPISMKIFDFKQISICSKEPLLLPYFRHFIFRLSYNIKENKTQSCWGSL